jgi:hypothetical protein
MPVVESCILIFSLPSSKTEKLGLDKENDLGMLRSSKTEGTHARTVFLNYVTKILRNFTVDFVLCVLEKVARDGFAGQTFLNGLLSDITYVNGIRSEVLFVNILGLVTSTKSFLIYLFVIAFVKILVGLKFFYFPPEVIILYGPFDT